MKYMISYFNIRPFRPVPTTYSKFILCYLAHIFTVADAKTSSLFTEGCSTGFIFGASIPVTFLAAGYEVTSDCVSMSRKMSPTWHV